MRRRYGAVVLGIGLLVAVALLVTGGAIAPGAVVARQDDPASAPVGPVVGDRIRIAGSDGAEAAAVSVVRLEDPYDLALAEPGFRYVLAEVAVEYTGTEVIEAQSNNFTILDTDGFQYGADDTFMRRLDGPADGGAEPGQAWGAELLFPLPVDGVVAQVRYGYAPLVDLRPKRVTYGDTVQIVGPDRAPLASISVQPPTDPYEIPLDVTGIVLEDERYVAYQVEIAASGDRSFVVDPADFWVLDDQNHLTREMPRGEYQNDPNGPWLQPNDALEPGDTASGLIKFLLPDGLTPVKVVYWPDSDEYDQFVVLAEPDEPPPAATSAPIWAATPELVTRGCEGVTEWIEDLQGRAIQAFSGIPDDVLDDPASADPAVLREAAAVYDALATEQEAVDAPPVAAELDALIVAGFAEIAVRLDEMAAAIESGDQEQIDAAASAFDEIGPESDEAFTDLETACPEIVEAIV